MRESVIEAYLCKRVQALGGSTRKVQWVGRGGAPDRLVLRPEQVLWVELKAPGKKPTPAQLREHDALRAAGQRVYVIDSLAGVDEVLR